MTADPARQQQPAGASRPGTPESPEAGSGDPATAGPAARPTPVEIVEYLVRFIRRAKGPADVVASKLLADYPALREPLENYDASRLEVESLRSLLEATPACRVGAGETCAAHDSDWPYSLVACEWETRRRSALVGDGHAPTD